MDRKISESHASGTYPASLLCNLSLTWNHMCRDGSSLQDRGYR